MSHPIRVLVAKPGLDGHDRGALVIAQGLRDEGMEVIYTGLRQTPAQIVATAIQEDVACIGLSSLSGAHMELFPEVARLLRGEGAEDILLVGGGIIPESDVPELIAAGVAAIFGPGSRIQEVGDYIRSHVSSQRGYGDSGNGDTEEPFAAFGVDHIGIAVAAIESSLAFYLDGLGAVLTHEEVIEDQAVKTAFVAVGNTHIELLEPTSEQSPIAKFLAARGPGIHHIAYTVPDIHAAIEHLKDLGYRLIDEAPRAGGQGKQIAFIHPKSSHGALTELCQLTAEKEGDSP